jgi:hypothetical protein
MGSGFDRLSVCVALRPSSLLEDPIGFDKRPYHANTRQYLGRRVKHRQLHSPASRLQVTVQV